LEGMSDDDKIEKYKVKILCFSQTLKLDRYDLIILNFSRLVL